MLLLFTFCQKRKTSADEIAPVLHKGSAEVELVLRRLSNGRAGMLEPTRESSRLRMGQYRLRADTLRALGTAVRNDRPTADEIDRKVFSHLYEYGRITSSALQEVLDIDVYRARDILADLQHRKLIVRTSDAARGPAVENGQARSCHVQTGHRGGSVSCTAGRFRHNA